MKETEKVQADVEHAMEKILTTSPELATLFSTDDPKLTFPQENGGFRWHYFRLDVGNRYYMFCYTTTRNKNNCFLSWVYHPYYKVVRDEKGKYHKTQAWKYEAVRETRRYKSAKDRAYKKYDSHRRRIEMASKKRGAGCKSEEGLTN